MAKPRARDGESRFLSAYRPEDFARPAVAVDIVVLTLTDADLKVLLVRRKEHPFRDKWALPGGFVRVGDAKDNRGEDIDDAAARELAEETSLPLGATYLEQLGAFGKPDRDPRMRVISIAYFALVRPTLVPFVQAGGDASVARWWSVSLLLRETLAFDHAEILAAALARARAKLDDSNIAFELVPETFSIPELRAVYEVVKGAAQDPGNFRKRFQRMLDTGLVEVAPGKRITGSKPAKVYRFRRSAHATSAK